MHYFNEFDPQAAAWLRELMADGLIPQGEVDERSITEVCAADLNGFVQCHFFAGIGGWSLALRLAGVRDDEPLWTGSCPCQPFSAAGKREGYADERDLWPVWYRLIEACRPKEVWGEQVASSEVVGTELEAAFLVAVQAGKFARANLLAKRLAASRSLHFHPRWLTRVRTDLATTDYSLRSSVLGAHSVRAPHIRQRLFWMADSRSGERGRRSAVAGEDAHRLNHHLAGAGGTSRWLADAQCAERRALGIAGKHVLNGHHSGGQETASGSELRGGNGRLASDGGLPGNGHLQRGGQHGQRAENGGVGAGLEHAAKLGYVAPADGGSDCEGEGERRVGESGGRCATGERLEHAASDGREQGRPESDGRGTASSAGPQERGSDSGLQRGTGCAPAWQAAELPSNPWSDSRLIHCRDGKARRIPTEPALFPLAHGIPGRVGLLRGAGNAINPWTAAAFIQACLEGGVNL